MSHEQMTGMSLERHKMIISGYLSAIEKLQAESIADKAQLAAQSALVRELVEALNQAIDTVEGCCQCIRDDKRAECLALIAKAKAGEAGPDSKVVH